MITGNRNKGSEKPEIQNDFNSLSRAILDHQNLKVTVYNWYKYGLQLAELYRDRAKVILDKLELTSSSFKSSKNKLNFIKQALKKNAPESDLIRQIFTDYLRAIAHHPDLLFLKHENNLNESYYYGNLSSEKEIIERMKKDEKVQLFSEFENNCPYFKDIIYSMSKTKLLDCILKSDLSIKEKRKILKISKSRCTLLGAYVRDRRLLTKCKTGKGTLKAIDLALDGLKNDKWRIEEEKIKNADMIPDHQNLVPVTINEIIITGPVQREAQDHRTTSKENVIVIPTQQPAAQQVITQEEDKDENEDGIEMQKVSVSASSMWSDMTRNKTVVITLTEQKGVIIPASSTIEKKPQRPSLFQSIETKFKRTTTEKDGEVKSEAPIITQLASPETEHKSTNRMTQRFSSSDEL